MKEKLFFVAVKGLIKNQQGKILLLLADVTKHRKSTEPYWDLPGGRIEQGDDADTTLRREIKEETGLSMKASPSLLGSCISNHEVPLDDGTMAGLALMIYNVTISDVSSVTLSKEHSQFAWFSPAEAAEKLTHKYPRDFTALLEA